MKPPDFIVLNQLRAARALLDWAPRDLAKAAAIGERAVRACEGGNIAAGEHYLGLLVDALTTAGIEFVSDRQTNKHGVVLHPNRDLENWVPTGKPS